MKETWVATMHMPAEGPRRCSAFQFQLRLQTRVPFCLLRTLIFMLFMVILLLKTLPMGAWCQGAGYCPREQELLGSEVCVRSATFKPELQHHG